MLVKTAHIQLAAKQVNQGVARSLHWRIGFICGRNGLEMSFSGSIAAFLKVMNCFTSHFGYWAAAEVARAPATADRNAAIGDKAFVWALKIES